MFCECGTGSFKYVDGDAEDLGRAGGSPRGVRRKQGGGGGKVNPYAERGLDRFSVVLSELETRRARILRRVGSDTGLVLVRFAVQSNGGWTPVVVKLPEQPLKGGGKKPRPAAASSAAAAAPLPPAPASPVSPLDLPASSPREREGGVKKATAATKQVPSKKASFSWGRRARRPSCYLPAVVVLTLVSLAMFGRVFAICLTSVWWYVLPTLGSGCYDDGTAAGEDARRAGLKRSTEKRKLVSPPPHARKGSSWGVQHAREVAGSPRGHAKGKRG